MDQKIKNKIEISNNKDKIFHLSSFVQENARSHAPS